MGRTEGLEVNQLAIFGPFLSLILLTWIVWAYMYAKRIPFIRSLGLQPNEVTPAALATRSPPAVSNPSDNLKNLFEVPVIFYAFALYLFVSEQVDNLYVFGSWLYVLLRVCHSAVHCTVNVVMLRFVLYAISCAILLLMTVRATATYFL
jgi:hypothetical protein